MESKKPVVLAVDDIPENLDVIKGILTPEYTVKAAIDGKTALKIAAKQPLDIIILDVMMPEMDGYEVCKRLKAMEATAGIPIIFLTAHGTNENEALGFDLGAVDYISKPITEPILRARIKTHIDLYRAGKELENQNKSLLEAAKMKNDVERILFHDLRSALYGVVNLPKVLLKDDNLTEEQCKILNLIKDAGMRTLAMVELSGIILKIEYGTYKLHLVALDALKILHHVIKEQQELAARKKVVPSILIESKPDKPIVLQKQKIVSTSADSNSLKEVKATAGKREATHDDQVIIIGEEILFYSIVTNLYKNALEAVPPGGQVSITFCPICNVDEDKKGEYMMISLENEGEVPQEIRARFFDKYITGGKENGTGLGSYSAWLIVKALGGFIELDTTIPGKTTLHVTLPAPVK